MSFFVERLGLRFGLVGGEGWGGDIGEGWAAQRLKGGGLHYSSCSKLKLPDRSLLITDADLCWAWFWAGGKGEEVRGRGGVRKVE